MTNSVTLYPLPSTQYSSLSWLHVILHFTHVRPNWSSPFFCSISFKNFPKFRKKKNEVKSSSQYKFEVFRGHGRYLCHFRKANLHFQHSDFKQHTACINRKTNYPSTTNIKLNCIKRRSSYRKVNTFHLGYKNKSVNAERHRETIFFFFKSVHTKALFV